MLVFIDANAHASKCGLRAFQVVRQLFRRHSMAPNSVEPELMPDVPHPFGHDTDRYHSSGPQY